MRLSLTANLALDVVEGRKADTVRAVPRRLPAVGESLRLCVNAGRPDFALAEITAVEVTTRDALPASKRAALDRLMAPRAQYLVVRFRLVEVRLDELRRQNLKAFRAYLAALRTAGEPGEPPAPRASEPSARRPTRQSPGPTNGRPGRRDLPSAYPVTLEPRTSLRKELTMEPTSAATAAEPQTTEQTTAHAQDSGPTPAQRQKVERQIDAFAASLGLPAADLKLARGLARGALAGIDISTQMLARQVESNVDRTTLATAALAIATKTAQSWQAQRELTCPCPGCAAERVASLKWRVRLRRRLAAWLARKALA